MTQSYEVEAIGHFDGALRRRRNRAFEYYFTKLKVLMTDTRSSSQLGLLGKRLLVSGIKAYQYLSRALLFRNCRFYPSCSQYALEAVERFGIIRGMKKAIVRILRCSPASDGGYDPVR